MNIETRTEPPEPDVDEDGGGGEPAIHVTANIYAPHAGFSSSAIIAPGSPVPIIASALTSVMRGVGHAYGPSLGEMVNAVMVDTGQGAAIWMHAPDAEVGAAPVGERLTLSLLDRIAAAHRRSHLAPLSAVRFHPGAVVPVEAVRAVLKAAGAL